MGEMEIVRCGNGNREMCKLNETKKVYRMLHCHVHDKLCQGPIFKNFYDTIKSGNFWKKLEKKNTKKIKKFKD